MLRELLFNLLPSQVPLKLPAIISCDQIHHLLHFYYLCIVPDSSVRQNASQSTCKKTKASDKIIIGKPVLPQGKKQEPDSPNKVMPSVTQLNEANIIIENTLTDQTSHPFDLKYNKGVMEIPALLIDDLNCILLANLLAFELNWYGPMGEISSFVSLFNYLIDTEKDVSVLEKDNLITNMTGSEEFVASTNLASGIM
jgi:Plant protein of unknown function